MTEHDPLSPRASTARATSTLLALTGAGAGASTLLAGHSLAVARRTPRAIEDLVELAVCSGGSLVGAWLALSGLAALVCLLVRAGGRRWRAGEAAIARLAPGVIRRAARIGVTVTVSAGLALPGTAALAAETPQDARAASSSSASIDLGWTTTPASSERSATTGEAERGDLVAAIDPTWQSTSSTADTADTADTGSASGDAVRPDAVAPTVAPVQTATATAHPAPLHSRADEAASVVVLRGDTLWSIAARSLDAGATDAQIAVATARWFDTNRSVIGDDPDVILPGQELLAPR